MGFNLRGRTLGSYVIHGKITNSLTEQSQNAVSSRSQGVLLDLWVTLGNLKNVAWKQNSPKLMKSGLCFQATTSDSTTGFAAAVVEL